MRSRIAFPFLTLPDDVVVLGSWMIGDPGQPLSPATNILDNWDYARNLEVSVDVSIDLSNAAAALKLQEEELELEVALRAGTGSGAYCRRALVIDKRTLHENCTSTTLRGHLNSNQLSGRLRLLLTINLSNSGSRPARLSPSIRGARLWSDYLDVLIEDGGQGRFPLEAISFSSSFPGAAHASAPWFLFWRVEAWDVDFSSAARLYINTDLQGFHQRVVEGDQLTLQAIMADTASQMISSFLNDPDAIDRGDEFDPGTVGAQVREWMTMTFPGADIGTITSMLRHRPGEFHAKLLATMAEEGNE